MFVLRLESTTKPLPKNKMKQGEHEFCHNFNWESHRRIGAFHLNVCK